MYNIYFEIAHRANILANQGHSELILQCPDQFVGYVSSVDNVEIKFII